MTSEIILKDNTTSVHTFYTNVFYTYLTLFEIIEILLYVASILKSRFFESNISSKFCCRHIIKSKLSIKIYWTFNKWVKWNRHFCECDSSKWSKLYTPTSNSYNACQTHDSKKVMRFESKIALCFYFEKYIFFQFFIFSPKIPENSDYSRKLSVLHTFI